MNEIHGRMAMDRMPPYPHTPILNLIDHSCCLEEVRGSPYIINKYIYLLNGSSQCCGTLRSQLSFPSGLKVVK